MNDREMGRKAGEAWVMAVADRGELKRLEAFYMKALAKTPSGSEFGEWLDMVAPPPLTHAELIAAAIVGYDRANDDDRALHHAGEVVFGEGYNDKSAAWLEGFVTMAMNHVFGRRGGV